MTYSGFNVFRYITFRAAMAALLALLISFLLGPWLIRTLTQKQIGQQIRDDGTRQSHAVKAGTPTMGGALIILALLFSTLMMADIANRYVLLALLATLGTGVVGFTDDYLKLTRKKQPGPFTSWKTIRAIAGRFHRRRGALLSTPRSARISPCRS
jgi:phospho-N-acetylmuramoyl-pentapeptide-transferase